MSSRSHQLRAAAVFVTSIVWAVLLAASFPPFDLTWLAWVALVPWTLLLKVRANAVLLYVAVFVGAALFHSLALDWLRTIHGGSWMSGPRAGAWLLSTLWLTILWSSLFAIGRWFVAAVNWPMTLSLPVVWVASEFARKELCAILDRTGFIWLQLGHTQIDMRSLVQAADIGGVWGITFIVALVNGAVFDLLAWFVRSRGTTRRRHALVAITVAPLVILASWLYGSWRLSTASKLEGPVVCLMPRDRIVDLTAKDAAGVDLLLWPETAVSGPLVVQGPRDQVPIEPDERAMLAEAFDFLTGYAQSNGVSLAVGCIAIHVVNPPERYNAIAYFNPTTGFAGCYHKIRPVPWSEFAPRRIWGLTCCRSREFKQGAEHPVFPLTCRATGHRYRVAATICYDTCFPEVFRPYMRAKGGPPDLFVAASNEGSDRRGVLSRYILTHARFRAIENRRPYVRNVDDGYSGLIDGNGDVVTRQATARNLTHAAPHEPIVLPPVTIDSRFSFYAHLGPWLPLAACILIVVQMVCRPILATDGKAFRNFLAIARGGGIDSQMRPEHLF